MKAKTILDTEKKDAIDIATELCYSEEVKRKIAQAKSVHEKLSKLENENDSLKESCRVLCNRCFTLTRGVTCLFCGLDYPCPHMPGLEEQVAMAHKLRKEIEKNG